STAINSLAGRAKAATGATAGVTRGLQWLSGGPGLELLDSPGVLWPERTTGAAAVLLAATGAVPETAYDPVEAADAFLRLLLQRFPGAVAARYGPEAAADPESPLRAVARRRGALLPGGEPDLERAAALVLADFRSGRLRRLTLESPPPRGPEKGRPAGGQEADGARGREAAAKPGWWRAWTRPAAGRGRGRWSRRRWCWAPSFPTGWPIRSGCPPRRGSACFPKS